MFNRKRRACYGLHGNADQLDGVIVRGNVIRADVSAHFAPVDDRPLTVMRNASQKFSFGLMMRVLYRKNKAPPCVGRDSVVCWLVVG